MTAPQELGRKGKAGKVLYDGLERSELEPKLLVPTPAQLARGERLVDADRDIWPDQVVQMVKRAEGAGWLWRVTYSQFLAVPPITGADAGQWVDTYVMCVRLGKAWTGRAWGAWHGTQRKGWKYESGQFWGHFMDRAANVNSTELNGLVTGTMTMQVVDGTGDKDGILRRYQAVKVAG